MPLEEGKSTTDKTKSKQAQILPVVEINKNVNKDRFYVAPVTKEIAQNQVVGYCFCDNCKDYRNFKRVREKAICITCNYIINE